MRGSFDSHYGIVDEGLQEDNELVRGEVGHPRERQRLQLLGEIVVPLREVVLKVPTSRSGCLVSAGVTGVKTRGAP